MVITTFIRKQQYSLIINKEIHLGKEKILHVSEFQIPITSPPRTNNRVYNKIHKYPVCMLIFVHTYVTHNTPKKGK